MNGVLAVLLSLTAALLLSAANPPMNWPTWLAWLRADWTLLAIFFWSLKAPGRLGIFGAWLLGFGIDSLYVDLLGLNGALFALAAFLTIRFRQRLRMFTVAQQCGVLLAMVLGAQAVRQLVRTLIQDQPPSLSLWTMALVSALLWPLAQALLERLCRRLAVTLE